MTTGSRTQAEIEARRFQTLRKLRSLERRMRSLSGAWKRFRKSPDPQNLDELREAFAPAARDLAALSRELGIDVPSQESEVARAAAPPSAEPPTRETSATRPARRPESSTAMPSDRERPTASDIVRASRTLDGLVSGLAGTWKEFQRRYAPEQLSGLADCLRDALTRANVLLSAVGSPAEEARVDGDPAAPAPAIAPDGELEARRKALDAVLWRITSDWQHLRKQPTPDRIGVLRDQIREALQHAEGLSATLAEALALGKGIEPAERPSAIDAVRFYPFRDGFTGTYNREGFDVIAGAELKRCRRYNRPFGLIMLEAAPTELEGLRRRVAVISGELRAYDILARYVDRTLLIGLPETAAGETRRVMARVLRSLHANVGFTGADRITLAVMPDDTETLSGLVAEARRRLEATD